MKEKRIVIDVDDDKFMTSDLTITTGIKGLKLIFKSQWGSPIDIHVYDANELIKAIQTIMKI